MTSKDFAIMYHYVRERDNWLGIHPLHPESFINQLDIISRTHRISDVNQLKEHSNHPRVFLTFDDGTKDQYTNAFSNLRKSNFPAFIAVLSGPRLSGIIPLVHMVHTVLSFITDERLWETLSPYCDPNCIHQESSIYSYEEILLRRYNKYILNFKLNESQAREILTPIFLSLFPDQDDFIKNFYLSDSEIVEMYRSGVTIGVHGHHHLPYHHSAQDYYNKEILPCKAYLENLGIIPKWYTPPFGGGTLADDMIQHLTPILIEQGFEGGFLTKPGHISSNHQFWFPRYDCNKIV